MKTDDILKLLAAGFTRDEILKMESEPEQAAESEQIESEPKQAEQKAEHKEPKQAEQKAEHKEPETMPETVNVQSQVDKAVADAMAKFNNLFDEIKNNLGLFTPMPIIKDKETLEDIGASIVAPKSRTRKENSK